MCWRTPERVLEEWRDDFNLPEMTHDILDPVFEHVEHTINARHQDPGSEESAITPSVGGRKLWAGNSIRTNATRFIASVRTIVLRAVRLVEKQSTLYSWLPRFFK